MKLSSKINKILVLVIFLICLRIGFNCASKKVVWVDERMTLFNTLNNTYKNLILAQNNADSNAYPLFYIFQKSFFHIIHYSHFKTSLF